MEDLLGKLNQFRYEAKKPPPRTIGTSASAKTTGKYIRPEYEREDREESAKRLRGNESKGDKNHNLIVKKGSGSHWCRSSSFHADGSKQEDECRDSAKESQDPDGSSENNDARLEKQEQNNLDSAPSSFLSKAARQDASDPPQLQRSVSRKRFEWMYEQIKLSREGNTTTVDEFHRKMMKIRNEEGGDFLVLVAALLSVQCLDQVALKAFAKLRQFPGGLTVDAISRSRPEDIEGYISTVNFYKGKAKKIWSCADAIRRRHSGKVPSSQSALLDLDGVGPKIAHLVQSVGLGVPTAGLVVDTHVHRVAGRLGWVLTGRGSSPESTRRALEEWVVAPGDRVDLTLSLISFGQAVCTPQRPRCDTCPVRDTCPSAFKVEGGAKERKQGMLRFVRREGGVEREEEEEEEVVVVVVDDDDDEEEEKEEEETEKMGKEKEEEEDRVGGLDLDEGRVLEKETKAIGGEQSEIEQV